MTSPDRRCGSRVGPSTVQYAEPVWFSVLMGVVIFAAGVIVVVLSAGIGR